MHRVRHISLGLLIVISLGMAACRPNSGPTPTPTATPPSIPTDLPTVAVPSGGEAVAPTAGPSPTPPGPFGPTGFPPNVNPLTGTIVTDPAFLDHRPILIKVSNESPTVRPQSGLASSDHVWEYQMEGYAMTRYTAVVYGQNPEIVGSVRSARLIDLEHLVDMYGGILVNSGASSNRYVGGPPRVNELLLRAPYYVRVISEDFGYSNPYLVRLPGIPNQNATGYHSLFAVPAEIWKLADEKEFNQRPVLDGMYFDPNVPAGGTPTTEFYIDYPGRGPKHIWRYDEGSHLWVSYTEDQNRGTPEAVDGDYLTGGAPLAFDNVVLLYAWHTDADFIEDEHAQLNAVRIDLSGEGDAVLMRDGQRFEVKWRRPSASNLLQFYDASGNIIAFKPGRTWFNVASWNVAVPEVAFAP